MDTVVVTAEAARKRHVRAADLVACNLAFIDCKKPGSHLKQNFSIIGAGVTQSADQVVNLTEPHGFQLGAAGMPGGITNNLHIHYTAEVFMVFEGSWVFRWGDQGTDGEIPGGACDIVSVPTWIFRGFSNTGTSTKPELIFTALGGDDTGGIIWHPDIVKEAGTFGLYLTKDNMMIDTSIGTKRPADKDLMPLIPDSDRASLRKYSPAEMRNRIVSAVERNWSKRALLCTLLPGHAVEMAPVIGHGISEDRNLSPKITNPHGFSIEWLRIPSGQSLARHRIGQKQVLIVFKGKAALTFNDAGQATAIDISPKDTVSLPAGSWRQIANTGAGDVELAVITMGDGKKPIDWAPEVLRAARSTGYALDHSGYVAPLHLLPISVQLSA